MKEMHQPYKTKALFYTIIVVSLTILLLLSCAGTVAHRSISSPQPDMPMLLIDTLGVFKATGDITGSYKGEKYRGKIAVVYNAEKSFNCEIYSSFAHSIASVVSDNDSAEINVGNQLYRIGVTDSISFLPFFNTFPFIFHDFVRILTGRVIKKECLLKYFNTAKQAEGEKVFEYRCDSLCVSVAFSKKGREIKSINYKALHGVPWTITYSSFKDGISRGMCYENDEKNNFSLTFDKISF